MAWYITYTRNLPGRAAMMVVAMPDDESRLIVPKDPFGLPFAGRSEIGSYHHRFPQGRATALRALLEQARAEAPKEPQRRLPGVLTVVFGVVENGQVGPLVTFPLDRELPPAARQFDDQMIALAGELVRHPYRTVKAQASWEDPKVDVRGPVRVRLTLRGSGVVPVKIPNPAAADPAGETGLALYLAKDLPPDQLEDEDRCVLDVSPAEVAQSAAPDAQPGDAPERVVMLDAGQELVLSVTSRRHLYLQPTRYVGGVVYTASNDDIPEAEGVRGIVTATAGAFTATAQRKGKSS
jgi:hypothetical protein